MVKLRGLPTRKDRRRRRKLNRDVVLAWRKAGHAQNRALQCRDQGKREARLGRVRLLEGKAYRCQEYLWAAHPAGGPR